MSKRLELLGAMLADGAIGVRAAIGARGSPGEGGGIRRCGNGRASRVFQAGTIQQINAAFATFATDPPDALFVSPDPYAASARAGGLMSYGTNIVDSYRQAGVYTGRVLKGAKPADLPVVQSSKVELAINIQSARMLGLTVPNSLLAIADEVIE